MFSRRRRTLWCSLAIFFAASTSLGGADVLRPTTVGGSDGNPALLPTGQFITPTLSPGSNYQRIATGLRADGNADADSAMSTALSPDGSTLIVLTSGFNTGTNYQTSPYAPIDFPVLNPITGVPSLTAAAGLSEGANQSEFVTIYNVSSGSAIKYQQIAIPDTYNGVAWDPSGTGFYVSGGIDDRILVYKNTTVSPGIAYAPSLPFIILNHNANDTADVPSYHGGSLSTSPIASGPYAALVTAITPAATVAGFDLSHDGKTLIAANFHNASVSIVDMTTRKVVKDVNFTPPGHVTPIGEMPFWVSVKSNPTSGAYAKAYVTSQRDDQVVVPTGGAASTIIPVPSGPSKSVLDAAQRYLYVACGNDDSVAVIDTVSDTLVRVISVGHPGDPFKGATPNDVAIGNNGTRLYVTLGGWNALAVIRRRFRSARTGRACSSSMKNRIPVPIRATSIIRGIRHMACRRIRRSATNTPGNSRSPGC
jgi:YVTN family beta-propeller protein